MVRTVKRSSRHFLAAAVAALASAPALADIFPVDVSDDAYTLFTDPNTGKELKLGGFSGLIPAWGHPHGRLFHTITDRGPNIDVGETGKAFPDPSFSPSIVTILLKKNGTGQIVRVLPLRKANGQPLSGLPSPCYTIEDPIQDMNGNPVARDPDGFDSEGLTAGPFGTFWMCDEYLPSVALIAPSGRVVLRLAPEGTICGGEAITTLDLLPGVLKKRVANRGMEGITLAPGGKLYTVLQRPLANPNRAASEASRNIRLVEIDLKKLLLGHGGAIRQLLYLTAGPANRSTYASDLFALSSDVILVTERRTDKIFAIRVGSATDITGLEDADGNLLAPYQPDPNVAAKTTIEQLAEADLASLGILPVQKLEIFAGLKAIDPALDKVEGICAAGGKIFVCPDNDFDLLGSDNSTVPPTLLFQEPTNQPKIISLPMPEISFP